MLMDDESADAEFVLGFFLNKIIGIIVYNARLVTFLYFLLIFILYFFRNIFKICVLQQCFLTKSQLKVLHSVYHICDVMSRSMSKA